MRVFITGASSGIGKTLAKKLVAQGHEVYGIARRTELLEQLQSEMGSDVFRFAGCDISDPDQLIALHRQMMQEGYLPDIVILNAAVDLEDVYPGLDFESGAQMMRTNVDGAYFWICAFIESFLERGTGQFIGVSSIFAHWPDNACVAYSASKSALSMLFRGLRIRYEKSDISFKLIWLGPVNTSINPRFEDQPPEKDSLIIASPEATADHILASFNSRRQDYYFPLYIHIIFLFLRWLPDNLFQLLTGRFRR